MNIEQLQRFLVVAECLNFTTAAERLYIGQSTISRQIAALEHELGVILLIRGPRSVELTEAGKVLYREGSKLMKYIDDVKSKVVDAGRGTGGKIRITTVPAYFPCLNEICVKTMEAYPEITLSLNYSKYVNVCQDLDSGAADIAVSYSFLNPINETYEVIPLQKSRFYVLCRAGHWIAQHSEGIYLDEMRDTDIRFGRNGLVMTHQSRPYHGEPATTEYRENESMESDLLALQSSDSVIILPGCSAENIRHNLVTVPLLDEELTHSIILLYRKDSVNSTIQRFLEIVGQYLEGQHSEAALSVQ